MQGNFWKNLAGSSKGHAFSSAEIVKMINAPEVEAPLVLSGKFNRAVLSEPLRLWKDKTIAVLERKKRLGRSPPIAGCEPKNRNTGERRDKEGWG